MVELEFLKPKMQTVASDVEKIPRRTLVPPFSFKISSLSLSSSFSSIVVSVDLKPSDIPLFCLWCSLVDLKPNSSSVSRFLLIMFFGQHQHNLIKLELQIEFLKPKIYVAGEFPTQQYGNEPSRHEFDMELEYIKLEMLVYKILSNVCQLILLFPLIVLGCKYPPIFDCLYPCKT